jgi:hypothetical protein
MVGEGRREASEHVGKLGPKAEFPEAPSRTTLAFVDPLDAMFPD